MALRKKARFTPGRAIVLRTLIAAHGWTAGAEIGVFRGETFGYLLRTCSDLRLIGVDAWDRTLQQNGEDGSRSFEHRPMDAYYADVCGIAGQYGARAVLLRGRTTDMAARVDDHSLHFVFIDADHTEEGCRADIAAWAPKVRSDGWVLGHDINWPSVKAVVDADLPGWRLFYDNVWGIPKAQTCFL